jgi:hypothetical protein
MKGMTPESESECCSHTSRRVMMDEMELLDVPEEGDYVTVDHVHWREHGTDKLLLVTSVQNCEDEVRAHMDAQQFWPNAWFVSDHGNWHRVELV